MNTIQTEVTTEEPESVQDHNPEVEEEQTELETPTYLIQNMKEDIDMEKLLAKGKYINKIDLENAELISDCKKFQSVVAKQEITSVILVEHWNSNTVGMVSGKPLDGNT